MKRQKLTRGLFIWGVITVLLSLAVDSFSQTLKRQSISCYGTSQTGDNNIYSQTAGQAYSTQSTDNICVTQGFQQPVSFKIEKVVDDPLNELVIEIFPNPAKYKLTLRSREEISNITVSVINLNGNTVYYQELTDVVQHEFDCSAWASGVYFIKVSDGTKQSTSKLIISK